jgi:hypothetical protein
VWCQTAGIFEKVFLPEKGYHEENGGEHASLLSVNQLPVHSLLKAVERTVIIDHLTIKER